MNIICNNCVGGYFYRDVLKTEYPNPFIWTQISAKEFIKLIENYDKIDFHKYKILKMQKSDFTENGDFGEHVWLAQQPLGLRIDDCFTLWFPHILYRADAIQPITVNTNIYYKNHSDLVIETYNKRLAKMNEEPIFMILDYSWFGWTSELLTDIINLSEKIKYKIILITKRKIENKKAVNIVYDKNLHTHPSIVVIEEGNKIKEFLGIK